MSTVYSENISGSVTASSNISGNVETAQAAEGDKGIYSAPSRELALSVVADHNVDPESHNDIRLFLTELSNRINAIADSDDTTLDQLSEVVAYIKSNRGLIESVTTAKVNVSDIIDNLTTNAVNKPLSAAQGVALKQLIDAITIPSTLPNPQALTFSGAATGTYDGSKAVKINIPEPSNASAIERGYFTFVATKNTTTEYTHTFESPYEEVPSVYFNLVWTGEGTEVANNLSATPLEVTKTGFTVRVYNNDSSNRTVGINWHAITDASNLSTGGGTVTDEQIQNAFDKYLSENPIEVEESDPSVHEWAKQPEKPTYTAEEIGADSAGTAANAVAAHNINANAHNDIRLLITALTERLNAIADSDDTTLDQLSEVVAYIKSNRGLIESVTTAKVNVSDIIDNLTTNVSNKPLSAAQGAALKTLIDAITVPTKLSELSEDSTHRTVTDTEKSAWNAKSTFSGDYNDLINKPAIPMLPTKVSDLTNDVGYIKSTELNTITGVISGTNLLHNADWAYSLVNQRGHSGAISDAYCIDRWIGNGTVTPVAGQYVSLAKNTAMTQRMEILPAALGDKQLTFSIDIEGEIQSVPLVFPSVGSAYSNGISLDGCDIELGFVSSLETSICGILSTAIPYLKITPTADINVKRPFLELGKASHMVETPPQNYASNIAVCQRYFYVCPDYTNAMGMWMNATYFRIVTACPKMRVAAPTLTITMADYYFNNAWKNLASAAGLVGGLGVTISGTASSNSAGAAAISRVGYTANAEI